MLNLRHHGWFGAWLIVAACLASPAAASQYSDMVQGLREREYFDFALYYLDQLAAKPDLPEEIRQEIPYEKALVLVDNSKQTRSPEKQLELLDQAAAFLQDFVTGAPNHPRAGDANSQRAEILLGKARVEIQQSRAPSNQGGRAEFQKRARELITQARQQFETAQKQHDATLQGIGSFVNEEKDPEKFKERELALMQLISALLNVCQCRYEEAQSYDAGTPEYKKILSQAAEEFEKLHQQYRNYTGGLYARLYQGKCFDDQGDTQKAMGIYNELLSHDGDNNRSIRKLQHKTLQFKLEALNRKNPPDSQVVVDLAQAWLKDNKSESRSLTGLAIQWEQAVGYEALGDQREATKGDKERNWRSAKAQATLINRFPSIYRDVSLAMMQRMNGKLGGRDRKPDSFETAQGLADQNFRAIQDLRKELEGSKGKTAEEIQKLQQELATEMHDATEMYQLALNLANRNDDPKAVSTARLYLAYVHFWAKRSYEAAILGQFVSKTAPKDDSPLAPDAAYLATAAFVQAFNETKGSVEAKAPDLKFIVDSCEFLIARWPNDARANDARMMAGLMYSMSKQPLEAADWYSKVPDTDSRYAEAQLAAGKAHWEAYNRAARQEQEDREPVDKMNQWRTTAEQNLRTGITRMTAVLPKEGLPPVDLMAGKVSLAQILISLGQEAEAITILTADPQSVTKAVTVADESQRPKEGLQRRAVAVDVYKLLLRAYIGDGKLEESRAAMKTLEGIAAGGPAGADVTALYVDLGKMLKDELDRFRANNEMERFDKSRASFETFLNDVFQRKEGHSVGTLSWVGETYSALGESTPDPSAAIAYFEKSASALGEILRLVESDPNFATVDQQLAVRVRLVHALRMKKDFQPAEKLVTELLQQRKDDLRLQIETAKLYQDWGGEPGEEKRYLLAIRGNTSNNAMGFAPLSKRLQSLMRSGKNAEMFETYLDLRYQATWSRYKYALSQTASKDKRDELNNAESELVALARVTRDIPEEQQEKLNDLYREIRGAMNDPKRPVEDLKFTADVPLEPTEEQPVAKQTEKPPAEKAKPEAAPAASPPAPASPMITYVALGGTLAIALAIVGFMMFRKQPKATRRSSFEAPDAVSFDFPAPEAVAPPAPVKERVAAAGPPRERRTSPSAGTAKPSAATAAPTAAKAATAKPAAAKSAAVKPVAANPAAANPAAAKPAVAKPKPKPPPATT